MSGAAAVLARAQRRQVLRLGLGLLAVGAGATALSASSGAALATLDVRRLDDGVEIDFAVQFPLSTTVEEALHKGVPLTFVAEAEVYRYRWYWRDERIARESRSWRLTWQPLTRNYRVTLGAFAQSHPTLDEALVAISRAVGWRVAPRLALDEDRYYVDFSYRLDTSLLPRPMQFGIAGASEWQIAVERSVPVPVPVPRPPRRAPEPQASAPGREGGPPAAEAAK
jgi:hypothetical protein